MKTETKIVLAVGGLAFLALIIVLTQKPAQATPYTPTPKPTPTQPTAACPF